MAPRPAPLYTRDYVLLNAANLSFSLYATIFLFLPAYLYRLGIREGTIGVLMAVGTLVGVALKPAYGMVVGRGLRKTFLSLGALSAAACARYRRFARRHGNGCAPVAEAARSHGARR